MPHNVFGKKLNRDTGQRQALLKGLAGAIIRSEAIETTEAKAKAAQGLIEKLITHARRGTLSDIRQIEEIIVDRDLVQKLVHDLAPRFKNRPGGYLRIIKLGNRVGDNAPMVRMEFVEKAAALAVPEPEVKTLETKASAKVSPQAPASRKGSPARKSTKASAKPAKK